jgi:recombination protein RecA
MNSSFEEIIRFPRPPSMTQAEVLKSVSKDYQDLLADPDLTDIGFDCLDDLTGKYQGNAKNWLSCKIPAIDWVFGKGLPFGRIIELFGDEASGKTSLAILFAVACQRMGGVAGMLDTEQAPAPERWRDLGLNTGTFFYIESTPEKTLTVENCFQSLETLFTKLADRDPTIPAIMIWDSVAGTPAQAELDNEYGDSLPAIHARLYSQGLRRITQIISSTNSILILINQNREKMAMGGRGGGKSQFGGKAIKFYSSIRSEVKKIWGVEHRDSQNQIVGQAITINNIKNKVSRPYRSINIDVFLDERGFDRCSSTFSLLKGRGVFKSAGSNGSKLILSESKTLVFRSSDWADVYYENEKDIVEFVSSLSL